MLIEPGRRVPGTEGGSPLKRGSEVENRAHAGDPDQSHRRFPAPTRSQNTPFGGGASVMRFAPEAICGEIP